MRKSTRARLKPFLQLGAAAAVALTARASLADHYRVPSGSMSPTVHVGDRIVVSKAAYGLRLPLTDRWVTRYGGPARGEVVVLEPQPGDDGARVGTPTSAEGDLVGSVLLKRVVAVAGDLVEVKGGRVAIDGRAITEPWASLAEGTGPDLGPVRVPDGTILVLGDNRGNSRDGRAFGWVAVDRVLGRAFAVVARDGTLTYEPL
jgi:signal peptidase I